MGGTASSCANVLLMFDIAPFRIDQCYIYLLFLIQVNNPRGLKGYRLHWTGSVNGMPAPYHHLLSVIGVSMKGESI